MKRARFLAHGSLAIAALAWGQEYAIHESTGELVETMGNVAVVTVRGPLMQHRNWCWDSYESMRERAAAALASAAPTIVLRIDSPGGEVAGCFEFSDELRSRAKAAGKRLVAYVDGQASSAAYAIACAADYIMVPPTGLVGSVGCIKVAMDATGMDRAMGMTFAVIASGRRKTDGNPHVALDDAAIAAMKGEVDEMAAIFFALVSRARGIGTATIAALDGAQLVGASAVSARLADDVGTFDELLARLASGEVLAQVGAEESMNEKEKAIAALKALAAGDDENEAKAAKAALKAMGVDDGEKTDSKAEGGDEDKDKPKEDEKTDSKAKDEDDKDKPKEEDAKAAAIAANPTLALAAKVQSLEAKLEKREEREERAKLMASRPDFAAEVVALMERSPLSVVRDAVKNLPKGAAAKAKGQIAAARAAVDTKATVGEQQGDPNAPADQGQSRELDEQMGLSRKTNAIRHEGNRLVLGVMTPTEARALAAAKSKEATK